MVHLLIQLYKSKFEERNVEMMEALNKNLACEHIHKITIFLDGDVDLPAHEKINVVTNTARMTFSNYFEYINEVSQNEICCISNADIHFDDSLKHIQSMQADDFVVLSRDDVLNVPLNNNALLRDYSQDSWFIRSDKPIPHKMIEDTDFFLGELCCDNRVAFWAMVNGYNLINPCLLIKSYHIHKSDHTRTYNRTPDPSLNLNQMATVAASKKVKYIETNLASFVVTEHGGGYFGKNFIMLAKQFFQKDKRVID